MPRTRVKICGITRIEDLRACARAGADAVGFVFATGSSRKIDIEQAAILVRETPPFLTTVALFRNPEPALVAQVMEGACCDVLQFHGEESVAFCQQFGKPFIKAVPMGDALSLESELVQWQCAQGLLLDSHACGESGGSGRTFDWSKIPRNLASRIILAGGLHPGNVAQAIARVSPYAVDVSSGVEQAPGKKSAEKIQQFMQQVT